MSEAASKPVSPVEERDHRLGADQPKLTLIEYGDFGCPFCFAARRPVESLLRRYDALQLVWRHFPDPELHPGSDLAAELSELASVRGEFWEAYSLLLAGHQTFSTIDLLQVAGRLDLDGVEAGSALRDRSYRGRVLEDVAGAEKSGVHATPTFFINGERLEGHWRQLAQVVPAKLEEGTV